jgi:integrase
MTQELFDSKGNRKYLTQEERLRFEKAARAAERDVRTFCLTLLYTGCRISEGLNLFVRSIDFNAQAITIRTLKKHGGKIIFRQVPMPDWFLDELNLVHDLKTRIKNKRQAEEKIWPWARMTASRRVNEIMEVAGIKGLHACPKGLRHAFAINCLEKQIPLNMAQKWLGHSHITTTAIYADALGLEERNIAARLWQ